jgi:DNA invertase Pin-like site-specific DNA recombinase
MGTPSTYKHFWNDKKYLKTKEILSWGYYEYDNERLLKEEAEKIVQHLNDYGIYKFGGTCLNVNVFRNSRTEIKDKSLWKINQKRGIKKAKEKGVYKGRKISIDTEKVLELKEQGLGATAIARYLGIGRASVYRVTKK